MKQEFEPPAHKPSLTEIMQQRHPEWSHLPIEKQEELLVEWLRDLLESEEGEPLRRMLDLKNPPEHE
jgi:hypothetical protein